MPPRKPKQSDSPQKLSRYAAEYVSWFASLGGQARMRKLTSKERRRIAKKGGHARWRKLRRTTTAKQRSAAARRAVLVRWARVRKARRAKTRRIRAR